MRRKLPLPGLNARPLAVGVLTDASTLLIDARAAARAGADVLEVRADGFGRDILRPDTVRELLARVRRVARRPLILTVRSRREGGRLPRGFSEQDRLGLIRAGLSEVAVVDIELSADDINRHVVFESHKRGRSVILSFHDFRRVPPDRALRRVVQKARRLGGDILKVAARARRAADADRLMEFCRVTPFRRRAFLVMGRWGTASRLEGWRWGSCLTYGHVGRSSAPGQPTVRVLRDAVRAAPRRSFHR